MKQTTTDKPGQFYAALTDTAPPMRVLPRRLPAQSPGQRTYTVTVHCIALGAPVDMMDAEPGLFTNAGTANAQT